MSTREAASARRWFPARWILPHESRQPAWVHVAEVVLVTAVPLLPWWAFFLRARWRYARNNNASGSASRAAQLRPLTVVPTATHHTGRPPMSSP